MNRSLTRFEYIRRPGGFADMLKTLLKLLNTTAG